MILHLELESHKTLDQVRGILVGNAKGEVLVPDRKEAYEDIGRVLRRFSDWKLGKADKSLQRTTDVSRAQLARLVSRYLADGKLRDRRRGGGEPVPPATDPVNRPAC